MAANKRIFIYAGIGAVVLIAFFATEPKEEIQKGSVNRRVRTTDTSRASKELADFTKEDEEAKFARLDYNLKNAFMPLVKRTTGMKSGAGSNIAPNQIPAYLVGGDTAWFYTGTAYINSVPSALVENTANGEGKYLTVGQTFKNSKVVRITPSTLVLSDLEGLTTVTFELIENRPIIDNPGETSANYAPMNPLVGNIGLSASKPAETPPNPQPKTTNTNNLKEQKLNELTNNNNSTEQKTTNETH